MTWASGPAVEGGHWASELDTLLCLARFFLDVEALMIVVAGVALTS